MFNEFVSDHPDDVVAICYNTPWPGPEDPLYWHNPEDNMGRTEYYYLPYVPWVWVDGVEYPPECYFYWMYQEDYDTRKAVATDMSLEYEGDYDPATGEASITVTAPTTSEMLDDEYRLYVVLTESGIEWSAPNGIEVHDHVMRRMYPDFEGTPAIFAGDLPQSAEVAVNFTLDPEYVPENCQIVFFVQELVWRDVAQADAVDLMDLVETTDVPVVAGGFELGANFPNPFNPATTIPVMVAGSGQARLEVVGIDGRRIRLLYSGELSAGSYQFRWDGKDGQGAAVPSGVYLARLSTGGGASFSRQMVLIK